MHIHGDLPRDAGKRRGTRFEDDRGWGGRLRTDKIYREVPDLGPIKNDLKEVVSQIQVLF